MIVEGWTLVLGRHQGALKVTAELDTRQRPITGYVSGEWLVAFASARGLSVLDAQRDGTGDCPRIVVEAMFRMLDEAMSIEK